MNEKRAVLGEPRAGKAPRPPIARVQGLRAVAGGRVLVDDVSFTVSPGRVLALVGASGSGKTTTGLALLGHRRPGVDLSGSVRIDGADVLANRPRPGSCALLPQHPDSVLNPVRRVGSVLREIAALHRPGVDLRPGRRVRQEIDDAVGEALRRARLEIPDLLERFPHQLSGGQQQRLVLAQALLCRARLLVADEPTTGQDAITRGRVSEELRIMTENGAAVVLLSHDLDLVAEVAEEVLVLNEGKVTDSGPTTRVFTAPGHAYVRRLLDARLPARPPGARPGVTAPAEPGDADCTRPTARLVVRDLLVRTPGRRGRVLLDRVGFTANAGECVALIGRSGSGKTTLARCIAGLREASAGTVVLDGTSLSLVEQGRSLRERAKVQYVFQDARASFGEHRTVLHQISRTAVRLRGVDPRQARESAARALEEVGLGVAVAERPRSLLSGGELQRAALCRALLAEPDVLVCDEITSGLDTLTQTDIVALLAELRERTRTTLLLITHDVGVAARLADQVVVLDHGQIIESGTVHEITGSPQHEVTRALLDAAGRRGPVSDDSATAEAAPTRALRERERTDQ